MDTYLGGRSKAPSHWVRLELGVAGIIGAPVPVCGCGRQWHACGHACIAISIGGGSAGGRVVDGRNPGEIGRHALRHHRASCSHEGVSLGPQF